MCFLINRKYLLRKFYLVGVFILLLVMCACDRRSAYEKLTLEEQELIDLLCDNRSAWEPKECGDVEFYTYNGELRFSSMVYTDRSSTSCMRTTKRFVYDMENKNFSYLESNTEYLSMYGGGTINYSSRGPWDTSWDDEKVKNYLASKLKN